jgi:hypothetical protein
VRAETHLGELAWLGAAALQVDLDRSLDLPGRLALPATSGGDGRLVHRRVEEDPDVLAAPDVVQPALNAESVCTETNSAILITPS